MQELEVKNLFSEYILYLENYGVIIASRSKRLLPQILT